ncbi:MAG: AsmA family protein [Cellvibrio sp.]|nr:AsmA family protein [Cellvibrio sp.]
MKKLLKMVGAIFLLVLLAIVALIVFVDPNRFKPSIESLAKNQNIALSIEGDLSWKLWPSIGLGAETVTLGSLVESEKRLAEIEQMSLLLALAPLFSGNFQADHLVLSGVKLNLAVDQKGKTNWSFLTDSKTAEPVPTNTSESSLNMNIEKISIENSQITYLDEQTKQSIQLSDFNLHLKDVNTQEKLFPVSVTTGITVKTGSDPEIRLSLDLGNQIKMDKQFKSLQLSDGKLQLEILGKKNVAIPLIYDLQVSGLQNKMSYKGNLKLELISLRDLLTHFDVQLETANKEAVSTLEFSSPFEGDEQKIALNELQLLFDGNAFKGSFAITDFAKTAIKLNLQGDKFNLDDYLPTATEEVTAQPESTTDTVLPLDSLRSLNLNAKIQLNELIVKKLKMTGLDWKLLAKNGMVEQQLNGQTYSGKILFKNQLDARSEKANLTFDAALESVQVNQLLDDLFEHDKEKFDLQGAIHLRALGGANGATVNQLMKTLQSNATFSGAELSITPINLQKQFCKLVDLVNKNPESDQEWQNLTKLTEISGSIKLRDEKIVIDSFKAGVENLLLSSSGQIDLAKDRYDLLLPFKLLKSATTSGEEISTSQQQGQGCVIGDTFWAEKGMSLLRCKGKLSGMDPLSDCGPDKELLLDITKDYAEYKIKKKHGAKIDEKKQEVKTKIDDKKKKLFDKLQKKLGGSGDEKAAEEIR